MLRHSNNPPLRRSWLCFIFKQDVYYFYNCLISLITYNKITLNTIFYAPSESG
jgi:hypothetical protein